MIQQPVLKKKLITKAEAAQLLGVCRHTIYKMISDGRLKLVNITASKTRVRADDVDRILSMNI